MSLFLIGIIGGGVQLGPFGAVATIVPARVIMMTKKNCWTDDW
jgi:hypothetical protein